MEVIRIPRVMQDTSFAHRLRGHDVGLVPTMGALHDGHMSLVRNSMSENQFTVVSIFVNPTQFGVNEDLDKYPRDVQSDMQRLEDAGVDYLFMPEAKAMYPDGFTTSIQMGEMAGRLCGAYRPGHFGGVAQVVAKLINIALCRRAYFGLKDYQQYLIIKQMASDLNMPVEIAGCATLREPDGLAMSSRNVYLNDAQRKAASVLYSSLLEGADMLKGGSTPLDVVQSMSRRITSEPLVGELQYAGVYDIKTLEVLQEFKGKALLAGAMKMGSTRLIDNIAVE